MNHPRRFLLANALVWGAMIIAMSLLVGDADHAFALLLLMIAGWQTTHLLADERAAENARREWACLKRRFGHHDAAG